VANAVFVHQDVSIRREYENVVKSVYQSDIQQLDFRTEPEKSAQKINK
jgi:serine protease inhibitor